MENVLRGTPATLSVTFYGDETAIDADGAVIVTVTRADGTAVVTNAPTDLNGSTHAYQYVLAGQSELSVLTATWSGLFTGSAGSVTTQYEVVGANLFGLAELRAVVKGNATTPGKTTADLIEARAEVLADFERWCGRRGLVQHYAHDTLRGDNSASLLLSHPEPVTLLSLTVDGLNRMADLYDTGHVRVDRENPRLLILDYGFVWPWNTYQNIDIEYEYGMPAVPPDIRHAALKWAQYKLSPAQSSVDERAVSMQNDMGTFTLATPGRAGYYSGIPSIDEVIDDYNLEMRIA